MKHHRKRWKEQIKYRRYYWLRSIINSFKEEQKNNRTEWSAYYYNLLIWSCVLISICSFINNFLLQMLVFIVYYMQTFIFIVVFLCAVTINHENTCSANLDFDQSCRGGVLVVVFWMDFWMRWSCFCIVFVFMVFWIRCTFFVVFVDFFKKFFCIVAKGNFYPRKLFLSLLDLGANTYLAIKCCLLCSHRIAWCDEQSIWRECIFWFLC